MRPKPTDDEYGFEAFFRAAFPKAVAVARRVTGEHAAAEDGIKQTGSAPSDFKVVLLTNAS